MTRLYLATGDRFGRIDDADTDAVAWTLEGSGAQCLAVDPKAPDVVYAGCRGGGLARSGDGGRSWRALELAEPDIFSVAVSAADGAVYAGTEPSGLFRSRDQGESFEELTALQEIPSREEWSFPPRPWTSHVRWIAPDPHRAERLLVGIVGEHQPPELDDGASFSDHPPGAQPDVHALAWHPTAEGRAYEAGGGGAAWSRDGGYTWGAADEGRDRHYVWALAPDVTDPDRWFVSAAPGARHAHGDGPAEAAVYRWAARDPGSRSRTAWPIRWTRCPTRSAPPARSCSPVSATGRSTARATAAIRGSACPLAPTLSWRSRRWTRSRRLRAAPTEKGASLKPCIPLAVA